MSISPYEICKKTEKMQDFFYTTFGSFDGRDLMGTKLVINLPKV